MKQIEVQNNKTPWELANWVEKVDSNFDERLTELAKRIANIPRLHVLGLTGPTCSGKTTAANKLTSVLEAQGRRVQIISLDDFFYETSYLKQLAKKKGREVPDYDSVETLDLDLLRSCVTALENDITTRLPRFNFQSGTRELGDWMDPEPEDLFIFEGIQLLYPQVDEILSQKSYESIYISPESAIFTAGNLFLPNEIRLLRRLVRDYRHRNASPDFTLSLWQGVRENEEKNIFPFIERCKHRIDSTMEYEIGMLKPYLISMLSESLVSPKHRQVAEELIQKLKNVEEVPSNLISKNSLYKEFIS